MNFVDLSFAFVLQFIFSCKLFIKRFFLKHHFGQWLQFGVLLSASDNLFTVYCNSHVRHLRCMCQLARPLQNVHIVDPLWSRLESRIAAVGSTHLHPTVFPRQFRMPDDLDTFRSHFVLPSGFSGPSASPQRTIQGFSIHLNTMIFLCHLQILSLSLPTV